jgi:hypothetical protein
LFQFTPAGVTESGHGQHIQEGYTVLTVSWTHGLALRQYIAGQEAHHRKVSFVDELKLWLGRNGVEYDPKYLL